MGNLIRHGAATDKVLSDVRTTLAKAEATGPVLLDEATRYLGDVAASAAALDEQLEKSEAEILRLRSVLDAENRRSDDLIARVRDDLYNVTGRSARDPVFNQIFPGGVSRYVSMRSRHKPIALELLASMLQTHRHKQIDDALVDAVTTELRAQAAGMAGVIGKLEPVVAEGLVLAAQRTANGKRARRQLGSLKRFWLGEGMTETEIHEVIPNHRTSSAAGAEAEAIVPATEEDAASLDQEDFVVVHRVAPAPTADEEEEVPEVAQEDEASQAAK